jgi:hypothetical protein
MKHSLISHTHEGLTMAASKIGTLKKKLEKLAHEQAKTIKLLQQEVVRLAPPPRKVRRFKRRVKKIIRG